MVGLVLVILIWPWLRCSLIDIVLLLINFAFLERKVTFLRQLLQLMLRQFGYHLERSVRLSVMVFSNLFQKATPESAIKFLVCKADAHLILLLGQNA